MSSNDAVGEGDEHFFPSLRTRGLTKAQKQDPTMYRIGDQLWFHARGKGKIQPGEHFTVTRRAKDGKVMMSNGAAERGGAAFVGRGLRRLRVA